MKFRLLLFSVFLSIGAVKAQSNSTFTVDCGENVQICPDDVYAFVHSEGVDTLFLGQNVKVMGGVPPYTFAWSCKPQGEGKWRFSISDILNDTAVQNPYFLRAPRDYICTFTLKVTDAERNVAVDSMSVLSESFTYSTDGANNLTEKTEGNQVYLTGINKSMSCFFPPMSYFAVINSDTIALPAYITVQETDSVTIFGIDSIGCHDEPRKKLGKWLLVSIDETIADENTVKLIANTLVFNSDSEKQIRIYSVSGQLFYSGITSDTKFNMPSLPYTAHCVCNVIINNKSYSFHLIRP